MDMLNMLNFDEEQYVSSGDMLSNLEPMTGFSPCRQLFGGNADLNSYFLSTDLTPGSGFMPRTSMSPLGQEPSANDITQCIPLNNAADMFFDQDSYFPQQPPIQQAAEVKSPVETVISPNSEVPKKPKQGGPCKNRDKTQLSEEQEKNKRQKFLERNRQAASKCRERQKDRLSKQGDKMKLEQIKNSDLRGEYKILSQEVHDQLGVIFHHNNAGCHNDS